MEDENNQEEYPNLLEYIEKRVSELNELEKDKLILEYLSNNPDIKNGLIRRYFARKIFDNYVQPFCEAGKIMCNLDKKRRELETKSIDSKMFEKLFKIEKEGKSTSSKSIRILKYLREISQY